MDRKVPGKMTSNIDLGKMKMLPKIPKLIGIRLVYDDVEFS